MSSRELRRVEVLARVKTEELRLTEAASLLGVTYRHVKRLWKAYRERGPEGLKHGSAGRPSNRAKPEKFRRQALRLVRQKYSGERDERFGPTLAAEHLASEDGLQVDAETLRRWMLAEGLWSRERKRKPYLQRRERRKHFGELVQLDGSFHEWLEKRGPRGCLMNMVDDATGTTLAMFSAEETTWAAAAILRAWIEQYGVPRALYTDWKNVYKRKPTAKEALAGTVPVTQFGRMCARLGIGIIAAGSPQAKGRVERNHGTHQDRLVKKLRRGKITSYEAANAFLRNEYLREHNERFACEPAEAADFHVSRPKKVELDQVFRLEHERTISNDWVIRYEGRWYQLERQSQNYAPVKAKVTVYESADGKLEVNYREQKLALREIPGPPSWPAPKKTKTNVAAARHGRKPAAEHPWKREYRDMRAHGKPSPGPGRLLRVPAIAPP
jgi:transposase